MPHLEFEGPLVELESKIEELKSSSTQASRDESRDKNTEASKDGGATPQNESQIRKLEERARKLEREIYANMDVWQRVQLSRHPERPYFRDYLELIFEDFVELHGDRSFRDDPAIVAGFARFDGQSVAVIGQQKGRTTKQKLHRNFGMPHPEGYRKACRIMELAERFRRPILTFIDTPGAYPGLGAEERGQSEAIGNSILVMSRLRVPVIATVIGEGGSGGALALGVANRVLMMQNATYSVITPEGCASILWRDAKHAPEAAEQLKLLADNAARLGVVDGVIDEPWGGAHRNPKSAAEKLSQALQEHLGELSALNAESLVEDRYAKFRDIGAYIAA